MNEANEIMFTRRLVCAMIEQAVSDAKNKKEMKRSYTQNLQQQHRQEAIYFLQSGALDFLCAVLDLPSDKIRAASGTTKADQ